MRDERGHFQLLKNPFDGEGEVSAVIGSVRLNRRIFARREELERWAFASE
jgi:hypothetical protein